MAASPRPALRFQWELRAGMKGSLSEGRFRYFALERFKELTI
jgi:hypothetical protein